MRHHDSKLLSNGSGKTVCDYFNFEKYINLLKKIMDLRVTDTESWQRIFDIHIIGIS